MKRVGKYLLLVAICAVMMIFLDLYECKGVIWFFFGEIFMAVYQMIMEE